MYLLFQTKFIINVFNSPYQSPYDLIKMALNVYIRGKNYYFSNIVFPSMNMVFSPVIQAFFFKHLLVEIYGFFHLSLKYTLLSLSQCASLFVCLIGMESCSFSQLSFLFVVVSEETIYTHYYTSFLCVTVLK